MMFLFQPRFNCFALVRVIVIPPIRVEEPETIVKSGIILNRTIPATTCLRSPVQKNVSDPSESDPGNIPVYRVKRLL